AFPCRSTVAVATFSLTYRCGGSAGIAARSACAPASQFHPRQRGHLKQGRRLGRLPGQVNSPHESFLAPPLKTARADRTGLDHPLAPAYPPALFARGPFSPGTGAGRPACAHRSAAASTDAPPGSESSPCSSPCCSAHTPRCKGWVCEKAQAAASSAPTHETTC